MNSRKSFTSIDSWLKDIKTNSSPDVKIFLVGNKSDLEEDRTVTTEEAKKLLDDLEFDYFIESSAKTGLNIENIFVYAAKLLYKEYLVLANMKYVIKKEDNKQLNDINKKVRKKKICC